MDGMMWHTPNPGPRNVKSDTLSQCFWGSEEMKLSSNILPSSWVARVTWWDIHNNMSATRDQLVPSNWPVNLLYFPERLKSQMLQCGYSFQLACHPGVVQILAMIRLIGLVAHFAEDTQEFVAAYVIRAQNNIIKPLRVLLQPLPIPFQPRSNISVDLTYKFTSF